MALGLIAKMISGVFGIVDKTVKDKDLAAKLKHELNMTILNSGAAQIGVNKVEAAHQSIFVAGWRPAVGWVCAFGVAYSYIVQPLFSFAIVAFDPNFPVTKLPELDLSDLMVLLTGMLGFGGLRTYEKLNGVSREK